MVTSSALQQLAENLRETLDVEVKNWLGGLQEHTEKAKLAKEIIALGNHGGGYLFIGFSDDEGHPEICLLYTSPSPRDLSTSRMPSSA